MMSELALTRIYLLAFTAYSMAFLFGWETGVAGGVIAQPVFQKHFGINSANKTSISSNLVSVLQAGAFFGSLAAPFVNDRLGRRKALVIFNSLLCLGSLLQTILGTSNSLALFYAGRVIAGLGLGGGSGISPAFVAECAPARVRGRITGLFQVILALGVTISYFVNYAMGKGYTTSAVWRVPLGLQLFPSLCMFVGLAFVRESPRWLVRQGRRDEALANMAWYRKSTTDDESVQAEINEIEAAVREEAESQVGFISAIKMKGTPMRFFIAFAIFVLQQFSAQNSVGYFAPQIFQSIGYSGSQAALLATGIYGVVKLVATALSVTLGIERFGRKPMLFISSVGMGLFFLIIGAILKTHPPNPKAVNPSPASQAMAGMLYIYVVFYSFGLGPLPWVVVSEIFNNRTRHLGMGFASATQWLFNFVVSQITPRMVAKLGWKLFIVFGVILLAVTAPFVLFVLPETKGKTLEDMDVVFGAVTREERERHIAAEEYRHNNAVAGASRTSDDDEKRSNDGSSGNKADGVILNRA